jgi:molybdate transport system ATP-binding protein
MTCLKVSIRLLRPSFDSQVRLNLQAGEIVVLLGPSGGGKSTLLRTLAGLERPQSGRITLDEHIWFDDNKLIHLPPRRRKAGLLFQHYALFPHLSVAQNLGFALPGMSRKARRQRIDYWLKRLQLSDIADAYPSHISGGQRQRVALARTLATDPDVLLLDEPFSAVESSLRHHLRQILRDLLQERSRPVLLVTHDLEDVRELADQVGVMTTGQVRRFGPVAEVLTNPLNLESARVLGWRNLLPVSAFEHDHACGSWGCLPVREPGRPGRYYWLGIEPRHWRITKDKGLGVTLEHSCLLGPYRQMTCRLRDGRSVYLHCRHEEPALQVGTRLQLQAYPEHVVMLE